MEGAREYAKMFKAGQYGRLYFASRQHARGMTFSVYVLPEGEAARPNGDNGPLNKDAVEVYGPISGHRGWDETYGWLHRGPWEQDFAEMVERRRAEIEEGAATSPAVQGMTDRGPLLHNQIMNLICAPMYMLSDPALRIAYKEGHHDARDAAAALALTGDRCIKALRDALLAMRGESLQPRRDAIRQAEAALADLDGLALVSHKLADRPTGYEEEKCDS